MIKSARVFQDALNMDVEVVSSQPYAKELGYTLTASLDPLWSLQSTSACHCCVTAIMMMVVRGGEGVSDVLLQI